MKRPYWRKGEEAHDREILEAIDQHGVGFWIWENEVFPVREILQARGDHRAHIVALFGLLVWSREQKKKKKKKRRKHSQRLVCLSFVCLEVNLNNVVIVC